ncbi:MAG: hypothetical protein AAGA54_15855 [Myxococcota bacterium]
MSFAIAAWLALAPAGAVERVGVAWHDQATAERAVQQRLSATVAEALGVLERSLIIDAVREAQRVEAYRLEPVDAREISDLQARVDLAVAQFRAGDLRAASTQAALVLDRLRRSPHLPGASSMAWQLHVLQGRIAWTNADDAATEAAWAAAVAVDPTATLSSREVPPDVIASYEKTRGSVVAGRDRWAPPPIEGALEGAQVEIDGVSGLRAVPPGEHFVVVRWPGAEAQAAAVSSTPMVLTAPEVLVPDGLPATRVDADAICDRLDLDVLVFARMREGRLGLQAYACGGSFSAPWYSPGPAEAQAGWSALVEDPWAPEAFEQPRGVLLDEAPWPEPEPDPQPAMEDVPPGPVEPEPVGPVARPWFRRPWVWVVAGVVVGGAVATGVGLGLREPTSSVVVTDDFLRP